MTEPGPSTKEQLVWLGGWIVRCADELGIPLAKLKRDQFNGWLTELAELDRPSTHLVRMLSAVEGAGWRGLLRYAQDYHGGERADLEALGAVREVRAATSYTQRLERLMGDTEYLHNRLTAALVKAVELHPPVLAKSGFAKTKVIDWDAPSERELVCHVSDTHFGITVDSDEVAGGRYDWLIAARRMAYLCSQLADYKRQHRKTTSLRLVLNGDLFEGCIHNDDRGVDMLACQIDGTRQILTDMIDFLRQHFGRIDVECQSGNHERWPFKGPGRPTAQKYDGAATTVFRGLEAIFRDVGSVRWSIPKHPFSVWKSCGHWYCATHGDSVVSVGNVGRTVKLDAIFNNIHRFELGLGLDGPLEVVMIGHYHTPGMHRIPGRSKQAWLNINGCASGQTAYSQTAGYSSAPVQWFWEVTPDHPVGDMRMVDLVSADDDERLDAIVRRPVPIGENIGKTHRQKPHPAFAVR
jgi:hypothetical protein